MKVITSRYFSASSQQLWPLLFHSKMDEKQPCFFLCGLPKPLECRLVDDEGKVGATRECISDKGVIRQRIQEWEPNRKLKFELKETSLYFGPLVKSIVETFEIQKMEEGGSNLHRTTEFVVRKGFQPVLTLPMMIGLKAIHRYVFRNWRRLATSA